MPLKLCETTFKSCRKKAREGKTFELEMPIKILPNLLENGGADLREGNLTELPLCETPYQKSEIAVMIRTLDG